MLTICPKKTRFHYLYLAAESGACPDHLEAEQKEGAGGEGGAEGVHELVQHGGDGAVEEPVGHDAEHGHDDHWVLHDPHRHPLEDLPLPVPAAGRLLPFRPADLHQDERDRVEHDKRDGGDEVQVHGVVGVAAGVHSVQDGVAEGKVVGLGAEDGV